MHGGSVPRGHVDPVADDGGDGGEDEGESEGGHEDGDDQGNLLLSAAEPRRISSQIALMYYFIISTFMWEVKIERKQKFIIFVNILPDEMCT